MPASTISAIDQIRRALEEKSLRSLALKFGNFRIVDYAGAGGQAKVFKVENAVGRAFAVKFVKPLTDEQNLSHFDRRSKAFIRELTFLTRENHKNIVHVTTGGVASWVDDKGWKLTEGVDQASADLVRQPANYFFYIMDFFPLKLSELINRKFIYTPAKGRDAFESSAPTPIDIFQKLIAHMCSALATCHGDKVYHRDIKADNILFNPVDVNFILADFGQARGADSPVPPKQVVYRDGPNDPRLLMQGHDGEADIGALARVLKDSLGIAAGSFDDSRRQQLEDIFNSAINSEHKYRDIGAFHEAIKPYLIEPRSFVVNRQGEFLTWPATKDFILSSKIRLPVTDNVNLSEEVERIIDSKPFQRLRGVRQLGPTSFVYPGATHTRFEHSLGTYALSLRYLETLTRLPAFREVCKQSIDDTIKLTILAALLHDIGHYPYSHWIEEIGVFPGEFRLPSHEDRAREIILGTEIGELISTRWKVDPKVVCNLIAGRDLVTPTSHLMYSIIDSVIDLDKLDYLLRDSVHCGVKYGYSIDTERFFDALWIDADDNASEPRIAVTTKGVSHVKNILLCRNTMYREVYWHKTVRGCTAMFKTAIYELLDARLLASDQFIELLSLPDDVFMAAIMDTCAGHKREDLCSLVRPFCYSGRSLYKPIEIISDRNHGQCGGKKNLRELLDMGFGDITSVRVELVKALAAAKIYIDPLDILLEQTPLKDGKETTLRAWNERGSTWISQVIDTEIVNDLSNDRRLYVFVRDRADVPPDFREKLPKAFGVALEKLRKQKHPVQVSPAAAMLSTMTPHGREVPEAAQQILARTASKRGIRKTNVSGK